MAEEKIKLDTSTSGPEVEAIKPPPLAGSFNLSKDKKLWMPADDIAKQQVEAYITEYGDKAAKNIHIK